MNEILEASTEKLEKWTSVNGLDLIDRMEERGCKNITEPQLEFLTQIRDRLVGRGAISD